MPASPERPRPPREGFLLRAAALPVLPANLAGAGRVYLYFNFVDPLEPPAGAAPGEGQRAPVSS